MTSHKTKVKVNLSVYVDVFTESHPEDIDDLTMKHIIADHLNGNYAENFNAIKSFEIEDVIQAEDVEVEIVK